MFMSKVSRKTDKETAVIDQPVRGNHEARLRSRRAPRNWSSLSQWNSAAAFELRGGWKLWAIIAIVIVVVISASVVMLVGSTRPPADVYARPTPAADALPEALLPDTICGKQCLQTENNSDAGYFDAIADYDGGIRIVITRFDSTNAAQQLVYNGEHNYATFSGTHFSVSSGDKQWFTHSSSVDSVFVWRKDAWVFEIHAPNDAMMKEVAGEFPY